MQFGNVILRNIYSRPVDNSHHASFKKLETAEIIRVNIQ